MDCEKYAHFSSYSYHDWRYFVESCRAFFGHQCPFTLHKNGCVCNQHIGVQLSQEKGVPPKLVAKTVTDLQQFSTGYENAFNIAGEITRICGTGLNFIELGAGNGVISAHLLMRGHRGTAVEIDEKACLNKLKALEVELPFDSTIPLNVIYDSVYAFDESSKFDFVIMNPPFSWQQLNCFLDKALKLSDLVFVVLPNEKVPDSFGNGDTMHRKLNKLGKSILPLVDVPITLLRTRSWQKQKSAILECQLCVICDKAIVEGFMVDGFFGNKMPLEFDDREVGLFFPTRPDDLDFVCPKVGYNPELNFTYENVDMPMYRDIESADLNFPTHLQWAKRKRRTNLLDASCCKWRTIKGLKLNKIEHKWKKLPEGEKTSKWDDESHSFVLTFAVDDDAEPALVVEMRNCMPRFYKCSLKDSDYHLGTAAAKKKMLEHEDGNGETLWKLLCFHGWYPIEKDDGKDLGCFPLLSKGWGFEFQRSADKPKKMKDEGDLYEPSKTSNGVFYHRNQFTRSWMSNME